jgi:opacity protein-like surface antigen
MKKFYILSLSVLLFLPFITFGQYASKTVREGKNKVYVDSLKSLKYNRVFPFWGQKAYSRGIDVVYPLGIMANYFWVDQGIIIDNFQLGFDNAYGGPFDFPLQPLSDSIIAFGNNTNKSYSLNVRPDLWVFPFIDIYGIFGWGKSTTSIEVNAFQYSPEPIQFTSIVEQNIATYGLGVLLAGGLGPIWISLDANITWNKPQLLEKATMANVVGIRMGKVFKFKNRPQSNISLWIGTMFVAMQSETLGQIALRDAIPDFDNVKDNLITELENKKDETGLIGDKLIDALIDAIENRNGESVLSYSMDKQVKAHWNGLVGAQYQFNKNWQLRVEGGVIGDRKSVLASLNYRILGFKKKVK